VRYAAWKQELDLDRLAREDDAPAVRPIEGARAQQGGNVVCFADLKKARDQPLGGTSWRGYRCRCARMWLTRSQVSCSVSTPALAGMASPP
jgi:hypothetical protein